MIVERRYPNFFTEFKVTTHEVKSNEELMEIDWIKSKSDIEGHIGMFCSNSDKTNERSPDYLMALAMSPSGKFIYFVVGYIYGDSKELGLTDYKEYMSNYKSVDPVAPVAPVEKIKPMNAEDMLKLIRNNLDEHPDIEMTSAIMYDPTKMGRKASFAIMEKTDNGIIKSYTVTIDDINGEER